MFGYGDKDEYVREQASRIKGRSVHEVWLEVKRIRIATGHC